MRLRTFLFLSCIYAWFGLDGARAQSTTRIAPDCAVPFSFIATGRLPAAGFPAGSSQTGCVGWVVVYSSTGFSALSLRLDSASDSSGSAGSWGAFSGSSITLTGCGSTNPMTTTTQNCLSINGYNPWVSVNLTAVTGSGKITGYLYGCRIDHCAALFQAAGGGGATSNVNLIQVGGASVALGQAAMAASIPVVVASNQTAIPVTNTPSGTQDVNLTKIGGNNTHTDTQGNLYNFLGCTSTVETTLSGTGYNEVVAGTAAQVIHVCKVFISSATGGSPNLNNFSLVSATITTCAGTTELFALNSVVGIDSDWGGVLASAAGKSLCFSESVGNGDKITISFAKF